jgi:hypothetical protein
VAEELAAPVRERADHRLVQDPLRAVGPVEAPLPGRRLEGPERQATELTRRGVGLDLVDVRLSVPERASAGRPLELLPRIAALEPGFQTPMANAPAAHEEIEISLAVAIDGAVRLDHPRPPP